MIDEHVYFRLNNTKKKSRNNYYMLEQSTGNRKTWARIPAQSKASFFPQKDFQILTNIVIIIVYNYTMCN